MMRAPTLAEIDVVELRLLQSTRNLRQSVDRTRSAIRAAVTRPSTVLFVAAAAGVAAFWFGRRPRRHASLPVAPAPGTRAAGPGFLRTFISQYESQLLAFAIRQVTAAWQKRRSYVHPSAADTPTQPDAANVGDRGPNSGVGRVD